jgi:uncharacterized protein
MGKYCCCGYYRSHDNNRKFDIKVDGVMIATVDWKGGVTGKFYDVEYPLPASLLAGKSTVNVRIEANYDKTAGQIFGCRIIRADKKE